MSACAGRRPRRTPATGPHRAEATSSTIQQSGGSRDRGGSAPSSDGPAAAWPWAPYTRPPSTAITWPEMYEASSEARKRTSGATSSGVPSRPRGIWRSSALPAPAMNDADILGLDEPRADRVDADAVAAHLAREGPGEGDHAALGGRVVALAGLAPDAARRDDVGDGSRRPGASSRAARPWSRGRCRAGSRRAPRPSRASPISISSPSRVTPALLTR